ncbi:MAG: rod shape-determining protein MreC [Polaribacter sp.]|nr:rod shape-determining protein MreC [Polaribacter sp.]MDP4704349.1 rod shape-determining protein MreC [Polaribacter sp.]
MQQLIFFIQRFKYFLFFILLESIAFSLILTNLNFQKSKFVNSANSIVGGIYTQKSKITSYFNLKSENQLLAAENARLRNELQKKVFATPIKDSTIVDTVRYFQKFSFKSGKIISNNYNKEFNFLTLDIGKNQGIEKEMAVINSLGIVGIIDNTSDKYARVQSVLNKNSKINARLRNSHYFGTLDWNGDDYRSIQLIDIPRQAPLKIGDTIETGGKSTIFPEGILIGTVSKINRGNSAENRVLIKLFNDMSSLGTVYVIKNFDKLEIKKIENLENE